MREDKPKYEPRYFPVFKNKKELKAFTKEQRLGRVNMMKAIEMMRTIKNEQT